MLAYQETLATATMNFIMTLRRLDLAKTPIMTKEDTTEVFNVWVFAGKFARAI
jgi:hypothetical protein